MEGYELLFVIKPGLEQEKIDQIFEKVKKVLLDNGATIDVEDKIGEKELAVQIKKFSKGSFFRLEFNAPGKAISEMQRVIKITDQIIRHMCVKLKSIRNKPQEQEKELVS
ncbi:MAG: 30S ribosomal protein S6 [Candidatus Margulisbacteria bacterium]|nr:30S ribosomal protein S6 [Candidatus Margulisiibacteriota bacterium]